MTHLYAILAARNQEWRSAGYPCEDYAAIAEILRFQQDRESGSLRFLRQPQLRALETYWYLRLMESTPHVPELYNRFFTGVSDKLQALGIPDGAFRAVDYNMDSLWERVKSDEAFVQQHRLHALRETLTLDYPSYILALAMGAGKTVLIGAIIATEFAMALEYPDGPFVENALVFAPGTTIIESLRELADMPYDKILPPRLYKQFATRVKLTFTRDGAKDVPVVRRSSFNVVVTNTEKIRIQKETVRKSDLGQVRLALRSEDEARAEFANLRLQTISSLPHLAIFSDEAHHTYGQKLSDEIKKVRKTVDYLAAKTNLICVVNTTGTPYYQRQPLKDVVVWYGLSQGIKDNILKDVSGNIRAYGFGTSNADRFLSEIVTDFFQDYGDVRLPNGAPAKLAIYFPQNEDLDELRPVVEAAVLAAGQPPAVVLRNTSESSKQEIDAFNRLNDPDSPHRIMLLVNKGTEGWNCPSLFACALARRLRTSNNFVLQASTRCLRQVPGNSRKARLYLSMDNCGILNRQLRETYGESVTDLDHSTRETATEKITIRKLDIPPLVVTRLLRTVVRKADPGGVLVTLQRPDDEESPVLTTTLYDLSVQLATDSVLRQISDTVTVETPPKVLDAYAAAVLLAANYHLPTVGLYGELRRLYAHADVPADHIDGLARQIEEQTRSYEIHEERIEESLALIKPDGFFAEEQPDGTTVYTAEIRYPKDREHLLARWSDWCDEAGQFGFHYDPYNFDSVPEKWFFGEILKQLEVAPSDIEDVYFTGAITTPDKTDFFVEYKDQQGEWRRYTPDFVIRRKDGKCLIVEVKDEGKRADQVDGENGLKAAAVREWVDLDPDRLCYQIAFASDDRVSQEAAAGVRRFVEGSD